MRDDLVGYLLNAIDQPEARRIETALADPDTGPALRRELDTLRRATRVLQPDREAFAPPPGLAVRTMAFVTSQAASGPLPTPRVFSPSVDQPAMRPGAWLDRVLVAATALAACVLVAPLVLDAITDARARRVERSLQTTSAALQGYAESHRVFPTPPDSGPLSRAGLYAPTLVSEKRLVADDGTLLAPGTALDRQGSFRVPTLEELKAAVGTPRFDELVRTMGGDFGYTLGHRDAAGRLHPIRNRRRVHFPVMADAPDESREWCDNHACRTHHVLFEDGHVERRRPAALHGVDHIYRNRRGEVAAGVDPEDAVIGESPDRP